jgi:hypothetical protein
MRTTYASTTDVLGLDALEPRTLFSAPWDFAGVGVRFGLAGPIVFDSVGTLAADGSVTGTTTLANLPGSPQTGPIDYATIDLLTHGRALTTPRSGVTPYDDQVGVNFLSDLGYALGALYGHLGGADPLTDISFLVQREQGHAIDWDTFRFDFQYLEFSADGAAFRNGQFRAAGGMIQWTDAGGTVPTNIGISSQDADGTLHLADGRTVFTSARVIGPDVSVGFPTIGEIALIVDTNNADGTIGIGIARRYQEFFNFGSGIGRAGTYRASVLTSGSVGDDFFAAQTISPGVGSARVVIDLNASGHFFMYDMAAYDTGDRTVISSGTWRANLPSENPVRFNSVILTDQAGRVANFTVSYNGGFIAASVQSAAGAPEEQLVGSATTFNGVPAQLFFQGGHVALDENGHPIYYETDIDYTSGTGVQSWYSEDLVDLWGGSPLVAVGSSRISPNASVALVLGVDADGNVLAWERVSNGRWTFRNITSDFGADPIVSDLTVFDWRANLTGVVPGGTGHALAVAGKNAAGDIILYSPSLEYSETGFHGWSVFNVSDQLTDPTPVWSGPVQGYQTPWGGVNIAGVDAEGDVVVVWTSSELVDAWESTDLSAIAGTPALHGPLSVMISPWNAIHITGLDSQGAVHVTWWAPGFGPTWYHNDLTTETGGPLLDTTRTTNHGTPVLSFIGVNDTLNIVGYDADGHIRIYWWLPGAGWNVGDVNWSVPLADNPDSLASSDTLGSDDLTSGYDTTGQSLYGYNADGTFSRLWWAAGGADAWHVQNLTEESIVIPA